MALDSRIVDRLRRQMSRGEIVLFTGAGFSLEAKDRTGQNLPTVTALKQELWAISFPGQVIEPDATLGELYSIALRRNKPALHKLIQTRLSVDPESLPDFYNVLFNAPWQRCYTLNVDDLESAVHSRWKLKRAPLPISATNPSNHSEPRARHAGPELEVIHLNGFLADPPELLTFSEVQYAQRIANQEPWYARCAVDVRSRPVVFVGTELREIPLWQHIELRRRRSPAGRDVLPPGSVLVTPHLSTARAEILRDLNVDWFVGTARDFADDVLAALSQESEKGFAFLESYREGYGRTDVPLVSDLAAERPSLETEYLLGAEPHWSDILNQRAIPRSSDPALLQSALDVLHGRKPSTAIALTGTAGTGKSTALMSTSLRLSNDGIPVLWVDRDSSAAPATIRRRLSEIEGKVVLAVDDADLFGYQFISLLRDLVPTRDDFAVRSGKLDRITEPIIRAGDVTIQEHVVPPLTDADIDNLIQTLDRHNRLGVLKGATDTERRRAFSQEAGRQMLVAMIEATSGEKFEDKVESELNDLAGIDQFGYALVCTASSQRHYLTKDEILLASSDIEGDALAALTMLVGRHLIIAVPPTYQYRARHRVIADLVMDDLRQAGRLKSVLQGLVFAAASKVQPGDNRASRPWRLLIRFASHDFLKRMVGVMDARDIYASVENHLSFDYHYWLQRGSLEVEAGDVRLGEHFLDQAMSLNPEDFRIMTEYGYMLMRKAVEAPTDSKAEEYLTRGIALLEEVIRTRGHVSGHPYHVLGSQGLAWVRRVARDSEQKRQMLGYYLTVVRDGLKQHRLAEDLAHLEKDIERDMLMTAVRDENTRP